MKWRFQYLSGAAILVTLAVLWAGAAALAPANAAAKISEIKTPGGFAVWMVREPSIPIIALEIAFRGGAGLDPAGKEGLANMVSATLDEGAGDLDSLAFQTRLDELAIGLSFSASKDTFRATLRTLTRNRVEAFRLLAKTLTQPRFDNEPVERIRRQLLANLKQRSEDPDDIAARAWFAKAFPNHPYGRSTRGYPETVSAITGEDLHRFVRSRFAKDNIVIGVVGDVSEAEVAQLVDSALGALPDHASPWMLPEVALPTPGSLTVIKREIPQSVVILGLRGPKRDHADWYTTYVMNYVLGGGGFTSRLYQEVREKRGLAYSVYSYLNPYEHAGLVLGGLGTANARVAESVDLYRSEIARMADSGISPQELEDAKTFLNGSFPLRLDTNSKISGIIVAMQLQGLGATYLEERASLVNAVTVDDVRKVAQRYLRKEDLIIVVVGSPEGVKSDDGS
ncbi:MAG: pitrilysin family protein [Proteobacteria bacterium]|nr:pitrilysin family protein [Pseudomonadota bacterium]